MQLAFIYGLVDPESNLIRYIGKTSHGMKRPRQHGSPYSLKRYGHLPLARWILKLRRRGFDYEIVMLDEAPSPELPTLEMFWIAYGRASKWPLLNLTDGGEGRLRWANRAQFRAQRAYRKGVQWRISIGYTPAQADRITRSILKYKGPR